ncbi:MAG: hypothetical protein WCE46_02665 [Methanoregula sp.]|jgi:hypothetical protein|uniref:hypothetical protein n=1 Tax=Methanoregula sp. TaxID=2052170 RepID=UPI003C71891A
MKENIRRLVLFATIVGIGSILIFVDIPLLYLIPLVTVVGFVLLIFLGSITVTDIKNAVSKLSIKNLRERPLLKRLDSIKFFEKKKTSRKGTAAKEQGKNVPVKLKEKTGGIQYHLSLLASSIKSFGKILTERKKNTKKPEEINKLLEKTITEKVSKGSALDSAATIPSVSGSNRGGAGGVLPAENGNESDPFLSLSDEDLGTGLLDGLDEPEPAAASETIQTSSDVDSGLSLPDLDMPALPDETAADADAILRANADDNGLNELNGLDDGEAVDETLNDLDNINLEDIDLGDDNGMQDSLPQTPTPQSAGPALGSGSLIPATPITVAGGSESSADTDKTDMSSFAAGNAAGSDDDMLSSLASDIKQVKKEKDVSLLRELKDFKAPATDIEKELLEMSEQLNASKGATKKNLSAKSVK